MASSAADVKARADQLIAKEQWSEVHALLTNEEENPHLKTDPELCWRAAWSCHEMANIHAENSDKRKSFTFEGFEHAQKGLEANADHGFCNLWFGIFLDLTAAYDGVKKRIHNAKTVKEHFDKAMLKNPNDALTLHSMGVWHFECADIDWEEMSEAANVDSPPKSSFEDALRFFQQAEEGAEIWFGWSCAGGPCSDHLHLAVSPNFYSCNLLYLGKCHQRMGQTEDAKTFFSRCVQFGGNSLEDQEAKEEARTLLGSF